MRTIHNPLPVKLFFGMLAAEPALFDTCARRLSDIYGAIDLRSDIGTWTGSDYYENEMGLNLLRSFIFFERLIDPAVLPSVKAAAMEMEKDLAVRSNNALRRRINLDPGYVTEAKVVLATSKDYGHRLYIGNGIYAEVTLRYRKEDRAFGYLDYTYMDYRTDAVRKMFAAAREMLRAGLHRPDK